MVCPQVVPRKQLEKAKLEIIAGGRILTEMVVKVGKNKVRRPDIVYKDKNGVLRAINVGLKNAKGKPIKRERAALRDLNRMIPTTFVPYN